MGIEIRRAFVLEMAARKGRTEIVEFILKDVDNIGSHMDHQDLSRDTGYFRPCEPLHAAAIGGKRTIARLLLARGADVNAISAEDHKKTPLHCAVESGNLRFISLLLASGANTTTQDAMGHTALHTAARREGAQAMELLLENGAAVHAHNDTARTPMYTAIQFNNEKCVKALLKHGATLPRHHAPALFVALSLSSFKAARAILEHFPNLPIVQRFANGRKSHALTTATSKLELFGSAVDAGNLIEVVKILVDRGADISAVDFLGRTALHHACAAACGDIAYLLVSKGANIHAEDRNRVTPFDIAVKYHVDNRSVRGSMTVNEMFKFERHTD
ncbi:hypothetical protein O9K51_06138 [Purpureocillium lavendulum]|uniref:Ankyrin repeat protein n=1 Tax=Purpureocillium lavendulum TaxID=1247861 RepID=A0AB34FMH2_9HYPO|nr:hypothetical protein O9K51_06138 [Purpureocillium lavendulum]